MSSTFVFDLFFLYLSPPSLRRLECGADPDAANSRGARAGAAADSCRLSKPRFLPARRHDLHIVPPSFKQRGSRPNLNQPVDSSALHLFLNPGHPAARRDAGVCRF